MNGQAGFRGTTIKEAFFELVWSSDHDRTSLSRGATRGTLVRLFIASEARTLLESLQRPGGRRLSRDDVEGWIDELHASGGSLRLNSIRDLARAIAPALRADAALDTLDALISASLQTGNAQVVTNERLAARAAGVGYDKARVDLFATTLQHAVLDRLRRSP